MGGNQCLKRVADVPDAAATRSRDLCTRLAGEEFMLVLPETDAAAASSTDLSIATDAPQILARFTKMKIVPMFDGTVFIFVPLT